MNKKNLKRMADYIRTIPQEQFDMVSFRVGEHNPRVETDCNTVGCIIGHCTVLDPTTINLYYRGGNSGISFFQWAMHFTGISRPSSLFRYLFSSDWGYTDNTPEGAADRIEYVIENGLPEDWRAQIDGEAPLSYQKNSNLE